LQETLSIPRQHYKFIERLTADETIKQKDEIIQKMSQQMGVPADQLIQKMYIKAGKAAAKKEVDEGLASSDDNDGEGMGAADDGAEDGGDKKGKKGQDSKA
jgi:hypothetical protein